LRGQLRGAANADMVRKVQRLVKQILPARAIAQGHETGLADRGQGLGGRIV